MVNLGDYLGHLLSELTRARLEADLESVRVAELYANHELLKHFPVPRVRVKGIDLDIPVTIVKYESEPRGGGTVPTPVDLRKKFSPILKSHLADHGIDLSASENRNMASDLNKVAKRMVRPDMVAVDSNLIADRFVLAVQQSLEGLDEHRGKAQDLAGDLRKSARVEFLKAIPSPPRVLVGVTSSELKEAPSETVTRISLRISEEGLEWTNIAEEGEADMRLVPE